MNTLSPRGNTRPKTKPATDYYVEREPGGFLTLRQTRFWDELDHPWDVCAVSANPKQLRETVAILKGSIDWSAAE